MRNVIAAFDRGESKVAFYVVHIPEDHFVIFKANLPYLGKLDPRVQQNIVLLYQLLEAAVQDMKPGGLLNNGNAGRSAFVELLKILEEVWKIADVVVAQIKSQYPCVR